MSCSVEGCDRPAKSRGWCNTHYERWRIHGDPERVLTPAMRFWSKVIKTDTCWTWGGAVHGTGGGYGNVWFEGRFHNAHRVAYMLEVGPIAESMQIDHLCGNTRCVRPDHLEQVTAAVNNARSNSLSARRKRQERCQRGHELKVGGNGRRFCPTCKADARRQRTAVSA